MPLLKITAQGLSAIGLSVALLWTCLFAEHVIVKRTELENTRILRDLELLQRKTRPVPVSVPVPRHRRALRSNLG
jgi:hypothetical protein